MPTPAHSAADRSSRFSGRVADYERGRPGYPEALFDRLVERAGLVAGDAVADVGAGTGLSTSPFLRRGLRVFAVEPNEEMRAAARHRLGGEPGFTAVDGRAEATGLADESVALVFAAQAFHWFEPEATRAEWRRIGRSEGFAALAWNARRAGGTPFAADYESLLLGHGTDYREIGHRGVSSTALAAFFGAVPDHERFENVQALDRFGLRARLLSSSYVPAAGAPGHAEMLAELDALFARHERGGVVELLYDVELYFGALDRF